ncbi:SAC3 domain-containing protein 1 [Bemisia tabaci]|uniref:SAC3 domain-containing protein 1 n=1 Tax=Bemisia tabaci TaxID=7038 RepID=UPI003B27E99A
MLLSESQFVKGACQCMCPAKERNLRSKERMIHILETNLDLQTFRQTKNIPADSNRMVKKFSRSAAGQELSHPELLRPPEVLLRTVNYLLSEVILDKRIKFYAVVEFITDALRSIRQDAVIQGISAFDWIQLLQPMVRFHSFVSYRLSGSPPAEFDSHLNYNHLNECLKRLLTCYDELNTESAERDEMEAVFLLLNPGHSEPLLRYLSLKKRGKLANAGFRISKAWLASNFAKCSREIRKSVTPILACTISRSLPILRRNILKIMSAGYSSKNQCYPVSKLVQFLLCNDATEAFSYCQFYNIECQKSSSAVRFERGSFDHQKSEMNLSNWVLAEEKLSAFSVPDILLGHTYTHDEGKGWQQDLHKNVEKISNMKLGDK